MVLVRIAYVADLPTPDEAIRMLDQNGGGSQIASGGAAPSRRGALRAGIVDVCPVADADAGIAPLRRRSVRAAADGRAVGQTESAPVLRITTFPQLVALAGEKRDILTKQALESDMRLVRFEDGRLEVALERNAARGLVNDLSRKLEQWTGRRWTVIVSNEAGQPTLALAERAGDGTSTRAPRRPIRACRRCWRDFPAPKWSRCAGLPPSRRNPILTLKT